MTNTISTNLTNTTSTNVTSTMSTNFDGKKVGQELECYIFHIVLLTTILLFTISITCYCYKYIRKSKNILVRYQYKNGEKNE